MEFLLAATQWEQAWLPAPVEEIIKTWTHLVFACAETSLTIHEYTCPERYHSVTISLRTTRGCAPVLGKLEIRRRSSPGFDVYRRHSVTGPALVRWDITDVDAPTETWYALAGHLTKCKEDWLRNKVRYE